jgi:hypothetical protein
VVNADGSLSNQLRWVWPDGTPLDMNEAAAMNLIASGHTEDIALMGPVPESFSDWSQTGGIHDRYTKAVNDHRENVLDNALPKLVGEETPGAELDTTRADEDAAGLNALLADLQQQAATGGGAWEDALRSATETAQASASSLGQTQQQQTGGDVGMALRGVGNAQSSAGQRAVGQGNILREKSKLSAQNAITGVTSSMGKSAAEQAAAQAAARRAVQATNQSLIAQAEDREMKRADAIGEGMSMGMSNGGEVPGEPIVFGDNSINDTELAKLSPGEIVLPISVAQAPNAPEAAAAFVRALQEKEAKGYASGGEVDPNYDPDTGLRQTTVDEDYGSGNAVLSFVAPHIGRMAGFDYMRKQNLGAGAPSVEKGGLLDTRGYDAARGAQWQNAGAMALRAAGQGPSLAPQMMQNTSDSNIEAALQAQAAGKAGADMVMRSTAAQQDAAGQSAGVVAGEVEAGQQGVAEALADQQARDIALSRASQQAAWHQTMLNVGLGLDQQAMIDNILSGAGQGLQALSDVDFGGKKDKGKDPEGFDYETGENEYGQTADDYENNTMEDEYAHGGRVKRKKGDSEAFAAAYGGRC